MLLLLFLPLIITIATPPIRLLLYGLRGPVVKPEEEGCLLVSLRWGSDLSAIVCVPILYLLMDSGNNSGALAPSHRILLLIWVGICVIAYFFTVLHQHPVKWGWELLLQSTLAIAIGINLVLGLHIEDGFAYWVNAPIAMLFFLAIWKRRVALKAGSVEYGAIERYQDAEVLDHFVETKEVPKQLRDPQGIHQEAAKLLTQSIYTQIGSVLLLSGLLLVASSVLWGLLGGDYLALVKVFTEGYHGFFTID